MMANFRYWTVSGEDYRIGPPPKSTLICFNSTQKGLIADSVVFPGLTARHSGDPEGLELG